MAFAKSGLSPLPYQIPCSPLVLAITTMSVFSAKNSVEEELPPSIFRFPSLPFRGGSRTLGTLCSQSQVIEFILAFFLDRSSVRLIHLFVKHVSYYTIFFYSSEVIVIESS